MDQNLPGITDGKKFCPRNGTDDDTRYKPEIQRQTTSDAQERPREVLVPVTGLLKPMLESELKRFSGFRDERPGPASALSQMRHPHQVLGPTRDQVRDRERRDEGKDEASAIAGQ